MARGSLEDFWACFGDSALEEWRAVAHEVTAIPIAQLHATAPPARRADRWLARAKATRERV